MCMFIQLDCILCFGCRLHIHASYCSGSVYRVARAAVSCGALLAIFRPTVIIGHRHETWWVAIWPVITSLIENWPGHSSWWTHRVWTCRSPVWILPHSVISPFGCPSVVVVPFQNSCILIIWKITGVIGYYQYCCIITVIMLVPTVNHYPWYSCFERRHWSSVLFYELSCHRFLLRYS